MQKILTLSLIMLLGIGVSACQSQKKIDDIAEVEEWNPTGLSGDEGAESTLSASGLVEGDSGDTLAGVVTEDFEDPLSKRVVYFEFDSIVLTPEATRIVEAHAEYLANNRDMALVLEGHADERGTSAVLASLSRDDTAFAEAVDGNTLLSRGRAHSTGLRSRRGLARHLDLLGHGLR